MATMVQTWRAVRSWRRQLPPLGSASTTLVRVGQRRSNYKNVCYYYPTRAWFSASSSSSSSSIQQQQKHNPHILMNPLGVGNEILPYSGGGDGYDYVWKAIGGGKGQDDDNDDDKILRKITLERAKGHFWMLKDLRKTDNKPILSNPSLIPADEAWVFPTLSNVKHISSSSSTKTVQIPDCFLQDNRSLDPSAQCTLVAIAYKDYGFRLLPSWVDPFEKAFGQNDDEYRNQNPRVRVVRLTMTETNHRWVGSVLAYLLVRSNQQAEEERFLYIGPEQKAFRHALRMHNTLTGYVVLLDGIGRVRFVGSGQATPQESQQLIQHAQQLLVHDDNDNHKNKKTRKRTRVRR